MMIDFGDKSFSVRERTRHRKRGRERVCVEGVIEAGTTAELIEDMRAVASEVKAAGVRKSFRSQFWLLMHEPKEV